MDAIKEHAAILVAKIRRTSEVHVCELAEFSTLLLEHLEGRFVGDHTITGQRLFHAPRQRAKLAGFAESGSERFVHKTGNPAGKKIARRFRVELWVAVIDHDAVEPDRHFPPNFADGGDLQ